MPKTQYIIFIINLHYLLYFMPKSKLYIYSISTIFYNSLLFYILCLKTCYIILLPTLCIWLTFYIFCPKACYTLCISITLNIRSIFDILYCLYKLSFTPKSMLCTLIVYFFHIFLKYFLYPAYLTDIYSSVVASFKQWLKDFKYVIVFIFFLINWR